MKPRLFSFFLYGKAHINSVVKITPIPQFAGDFWTKRRLNQTHFHRQHDPRPSNHGVTTSSRTPPASGLPPFLPLLLSPQRHCVAETPSQLHRVARRPSEVPGRGMLRENDLCTHMNRRGGRPSIHKRRRTCVLLRILKVTVLTVCCHTCVGLRVAAGDARGRRGNDGTYFLHVVEV